MNLFKRRDDAFKGNVYEEEEKEPRAGLSKEIQIAIAFVAVLIVGSICGFSATSGLRAGEPPAPQSAVPVADTKIPTAREAYDIAYQYVVDQGSPVELASAVGIWTPGVSDVQLAAGRTGWTFYFYRPEMADMVTVVVGREENVRIEAVVPWEPAPELTHVQSWRVDSPQAVEGMLANCGDTLESVSDGVVELRLTTAAENRSVLWQVSVTSEENPLAVCEINIDGTTGLARQ